MLKKKIDYGREFLEAHLELFLCPKCQSKFKEVRGNTMICLSNHQYDLSKRNNSFSKSSFN